MKVKSESEVAQSCLTLSDPMDCSLPGSSIHGIFQARVLEWVAIAFSAGLFFPSLIRSCLNLPFGEGPGGRMKRSDQVLWEDLEGAGGEGGGRGDRDGEDM